MTSALHHRTTDTDDERAAMARAIDEEIADHHASLQAQHLAYGSRLLKIYHPSRPRISPWLDSGSWVRRWLGTPAMAVTLVVALLSIVVQVVSNEIIPGIRGLLFLVFFGSLTVRIVYRRYSGRSTRIADHPQERARAYADTAKDCISIGTTHVSWWIHGAFFDRVKIVPLSSVRIDLAPHRITIASADGVAIVSLDHPQIVVVERAGSRAAPRRQAGTFGRRT